MNIWTASRPNWGSPFGTATPVTELNSPVSDRDPRISPDGLVIFSTSDRTGPPSNHLYMASRLDTSSPFSSVLALSALNTSGDTLTPGFAFFHDELFFASDRAGGLGSWDLWNTRYTGLLGVGIASLASRRDLRFSAPASPSSIYVAAAALGSTPGIPIDTRVLPLNADPLLQLSIGGLPPILTGYVGTLDQDGIASGAITFAGFPELVGLRFVNAFVVLDPTAPSGIRTISNAHEVLVQ